MAKICHVAELAAIIFGTIVLRRPVLLGGSNGIVSRTRSAGPEGCRQATGRLTFYPARHRMPALTNLSR
jgi:hypothetical protein